MRVEVPEEEVVRLLALYLEEAGFVKTMWSLERESGVVARRFGKEIAFARELVLDGAWEELRTFLQVGRVSHRTRGVRRVSLRRGWGTRSLYNT